MIALTSLLVALVIPVAGIAGNGQNNGQGNGGGQNGHQDGQGSGYRNGSADGSGAAVPASLLAKAQANPDQLFSVIVQGKLGQDSGKVRNDVQGGNDGSVKRAFHSIGATTVSLTGKQLLHLAKNPRILAITEDVPMHSSGYQDSTMWPTSVDVTPVWNSLDALTGLVVGPAPQAPAIAIIDSGVDTTKVRDFGGRVVASVNLSSLSPLAKGDDQGHGTMVAGLAAGSSAAYPGAAQNAPIVSVRTADALGQSRTSDVIAAVDWILANKAKYNIRVANLSLGSVSNSSFRFDPLDRAVEKLWFAGVVVVASAGNFGTGAPVTMASAPGNDPFIITVGATDQNMTSDPLDDTVPAWSAYGYTLDGFSKPDMVAPGRYMIAPVPAGATIPATVPERVVAPGYMWMSGTSFAAPIVSGAAAQILARHPDWTPDQVKGALMLTSNYLGLPNPQSVGVGEIDAAAAASLVDTPPNPNENFNAYLVTDPVTGGVTFDQASWSHAVALDASWSTAAWTSASWSHASWATASWSTASWSSAAWTSAASNALLVSTTTYSEATYAP